MATRAENLSLTEMVLGTCDSSSLTPVERTALEFCKARALAGKPVTQLDITIAIGSQNFTGGTAAGVLKRLEQKGQIVRKFYQRGLQVCFPDSGICTTEPACRAPHWRSRDESVQTVPVQAVRRVNHTAATLIEIEARRLGKSLPDFLQDLIWNGLQMHLEAQGDGE
jgi:hypothetical protein